MSDTEAELQRLREALRRIPAAIDAGCDYCGCTDEIAAVLADVFGVERYEPELVNAFGLKVRPARDLAALIAEVLGPDR